MGRLYAERAAREGADAVVIWDSDAGALAEVERGLPGRVLSATVDVADAVVVDAAARDVNSALGGVDVLLNNAGTIRGNGLFWEASAADAEAMVRVNLLGAMNVARAFLPGMLVGAGPKRLVTIASAAAFTPNPRMAVYAASKTAVASWSESLRIELERERHRNVKVTTVYPSYVATGMFAGARGPLFTPIVEPEKVVDAVWAAMLAGRPQVLVPSSVPLAKVLRGVLPSGAFDAIAGRLFGVYGSMDAFEGRSS